MDESNFIVIQTKKEETTDQKNIHQTNPIAKKFVVFQKQDRAKFCVKDLFKK